MRNRGLALLGLISAVLLVCAWFLGQARAPQTEQEKPLLFPQLAEQLPRTDRIHVRGSSSRFSLVRRNQLWGMDRFDGYPARADKIRALGLGLAGLRRLQGKTRLAHLYARLGVEGAGAEDSRSVELRLEDRQGMPLAELIVGLERKSRGPENRPGLYVRHPGKAQSWLVEGQLSVSAEPLDWIQRQLFDIPAASIAEIQVQHADGDRYRLYREAEGQEDFILEPVPDGMRQAPAVILNKSGALLQDFSITGVRRARADEPEDTVVQVHTFTGLGAQLRISWQQDQAHARIRFTPAGNAEAENLNQRLAGWAFALPKFRQLLLRRKSDGLIRAAPAP